MKYIRELNLLRCKTLICKIEYGAAFHYVRNFCFKSIFTGKKLHTKLIVWIVLWKLKSVLHKKYSAFIVTY